MASLQELQRIDRELFSELTESPINPAFLHMSTPLIGKIHLHSGSELFQPVE